MTTITRIATLQRALRELGRIRLGDQVEDPRTHRRHPRKLLTFRLTSASHEYILAAADAYGGEVRAWESPRGREWEVTIESPFLDVLVPPGDAVTQAYELWSGGGCQRRCDGIAQESGAPCACPSDVDERVELAARGQACKPTTRLWVILPRLPDLGRWRLEAHGYYAAIELAGMAELASMATSRGVMLPARLRIDHRRRKVPGAPVRDYIVPVLELTSVRMADLVDAGMIPTPGIGPGAAPAGALGPGAGVDGSPPVPAPRAALPAPRAARVERPELGPEPPLPREAAFERTPEPTFGGEPPEIAGGFAPLEDLLADEPPDAPEMGAPRLLALEEFRALTSAQRATVGTVKGAAERLFGERVALLSPGQWDLTPAEWGALATELGL